MNFRVAVALAVAAIGVVPAHAQEDFPFGFEMTLDAAPMMGSKRRPTLDIGDAGETRVELWCGGGRGQFSIAGNTVVFVPGPNETRTCTPAQTQADAALLQSLSQATTWLRQGEVVTFVGAATPLRFRINTN